MYNRENIIIKGWNAQSQPYNYVMRNFECGTFQNLHPVSIPRTCDIVPSGAFRVILDRREIYWHADGVLVPE